MIPFRLRRQNGNHCAASLEPAGNSHRSHQPQLAVDRPHAEETMTLSITSSAFTNGGEIPAKYTCQGNDIAPPLQWTGVPGDAKEPGPDRG